MNPTIKLNAFIELKAQRAVSVASSKRWRSYGWECIQCGMLYVLNDKSPGCLDRAAKCYASRYGVSVITRWSKIRSLQSRRRSYPEVRQRQRDSQHITHVQCTDCKHHFNLAKMYGGVYRKCPVCGRESSCPGAITGSSSAKATLPRHSEQNQTRGRR